MGRALSDVVLLVFQIQQRGQPAGGAKQHVAPVAAVTPVGTATGHILFPSEADAPVAAVPGLHIDFRLVDKHDPISKGQGPSYPDNCALGLETKAIFDNEVHKLNSTSTGRLCPRGDRPRTFRACTGSFKKGTRGGRGRSHRDFETIPDRTGKRWRMRN